jgi:hypothetical protein
MSAFGQKRTLCFDLIPGSSDMEMIPVEAYDNVKDRDKTHDTILKSFSNVTICSVVL